MPKPVTPSGSNHGLVNGDFLTIVGANPASFDGFVGPVTVVSSTQFTFPRDMGTSGLTGSSGTFDRHVAAGVVRNGSVAAVTTVSPHGFFFGQVVKLQGAYVNGEGDKLNRFYGVITVKTFTDRTFSYDMKALPSGTDPDPTGSVRSPTGPVAYAAHWDIRHFFLENNIYDLYATDNNTAIFPRGISMFGLDTPDIPPYIFPNFIYRGNIVRHIDEKVPMGTPQPSYGIFATTVGNGIVEQNIIDVSATHPLTYYDSGKLAHLQNMTTSGALVPGFDGTKQQTVDDLETRIADALTMSLL